MGIVNVTPDSFSDGGRFRDVDEACDHAVRMIEAGAAIIDIGGESTRPGASPVPADQQLSRVIPLLERLRDESDCWISVDTGDAEVIRAVTAAGADMINDVFALRQAGALESVVRTRVAVCLMHMQGEPATMQDDPRYADVTGEVLRFLRERSSTCRNAGVDAGSIAVDPGFGFGKTHAHNMTLLAELGCFRELGYPVLAGLSRKGTLGYLTGRPVDERVPAGLAAAVIAVERGVAIVRTHDVPATVDALKIVDAVRKAGTAVAAGPAG